MVDVAEETNEKNLVDVDELIKKAKHIPGYYEKVVDLWDICSAEQIQAIPIIDCKKCEYYASKEQINPRIKKDEGEQIRIVQKPNVTGEWILYDYDIGCYRNTGFACSNCHTEYGNEPFYQNGGGLRFEYCPKCGAKMLVKGER